MIFRKKKRMIDVRELQRRGVVRIPKQNVVVPTDRDGFVEFGSRTKQVRSETPTPTSSSNTEFFGFMDSTSSPAAVPSSLNRDESERITELDNKIYKLENRIELLEKKLDVNQPSDNPVGVMGW
jgi:hypothetical protein